MQLTFLGTETQGGGSPTLYLTDRDTYVVQGWRIGEHVTRVEIPHRLLGHLRHGRCLSTRLEDTGRGSFVLHGVPVTDREALARMDMPGHETCVEVPTSEEVWVNGAATG